jgi:ATP-binding cassette, subfamily B, bacterial
LLARLDYRFQRFGEILSYLPRAWRLVWAAAHGWSAAWLALLLVQGILPAASVYLTKLLVDQLISTLKGERTWAQMQPAVWLALWLATAMILIEVLRSLIGLVRVAQSERLQNHIADLIHRQSITLDYAFYELAEYYDRLHRARSEAGYRPLALLESAGSLLQHSITLLAMMALLLPFGWWLPLVLMLSTLPALLIVFRYTLRQYEWQHLHTSHQRRAYYYDWLMTQSETAAELRLFNLGEHFRRAYQELSQRLSRSKWRLAKEQSLAELSAGLLALLTTGTVLTWIGWRALQGAVSLGTLTMFYQAFSQGQQLLRSALGHVGQLYSNGLFLGNLFEFLELKPQIIDPVQAVTVPNKLSHGIHFTNVSFTYPGSARPVFQDFNLSVPAGKITAIVGFNGAGKTTLIKLLCRLYDPESGKIEMDGLDLRELQLGDLRQSITVLLQEPVHYNDTVKQNVQFGALQQTVTEEELDAAVAAAGAAEIVQGLPHGYETVLGKWFAEGTELSVGQWQRLALARAFLRSSPIVLLDEPTSAMDSWAESDWLKRFRAVMAGRTVILITHRFTTAVQADIIHVMVAGRIVESGTHQELLQLDGLYAESWREQTKGLVR